MAENKKPKNQGRVLNYTPPRMMPRQRARDIGDMPTDTEPGGVETALASYLKSSKISNGAFSRAIGVSEQAVAGWRLGEDVPSLAVAYEIERITKGVVPMESWLALPSAKARLAEMRRKQPVMVQKIKPGPAGGFAAPAEVKRTETVTREKFDLEGRKIEKNRHKVLPERAYEAAYDEDPDDL